MAIRPAKDHSRESALPVETALATRKFRFLVAVWLLSSVGIYIISTTYWHRISRRELYEWVMVIPCTLDFLDTICRPNSDFWKRVCLILSWLIWAGIITLVSNWFVERFLVRWLPGDPDDNDK